LEETPRRYCGTLAGDGRPGPIEERIGRRLVRLVDPESDEGRDLLDQGRVELVGPEGDRLGSLRLQEAYDRLRRRLEERLAEEEPAAGARSGLREGLTRLEGWSRRLVRERERST